MLKSCYTTNVGKGGSKVSAEKMLEWSLNDKELAKGRCKAVFWAEITASRKYCDLANKDRVLVILPVHLSQGKCLSVPKMRYI